MTPRKHTLDAIVERYRAALAAYLAGDSEAALEEAYETGRRGLSSGLGVLEMAAANRDGMERALRGVSAGNRDAAVEAAWRCFLESLSPFEMVLRGVRDSNTRLRQSVANLQTVKDALETERHRYQALFDLAPDAYVVTDADGVIREVNRAGAALLGSSNAELQGRWLAEFMSAADRQDFPARLETRADARIDEWHVAIQISARAFPAVLTVAAESSTPGAPSLRWLIRDATERKRREQARARSLVGQTKAQAAKRFEFLAEASSLLSESTDIETRLRSVARLAVPYLAEWCFVNLAASNGSFRQLDVAHAERRATRVVEDLRRHCLFPEGLFETGIVHRITPAWCAAAAANPVHARLLDHFRGRSAMVVAMEIYDRVPGLLIFISGPGRRPFGDADLALAKDLCRRCAMAVENARLYREVMVERDRAAKASRAKDEFLAILGHELRNPLMPVIGWTRAFKNHALVAQDATLSEGILSMERNAQTLARLVDDCLDLTRISEGRIRIERERVDLNQIARECVESVRALAAAKNIRLESELRSAAAHVVGDRVRLEQVITNLLVNAVKYTTAAGSISVVCECDGNGVKVAVRDSGIGIQPAFLEQIFEPFRRGTNSWLTHESGLGLGLAIARRIVEMHGGKVWAESKGLNSGSTFHLQLPAAGSLAQQPQTQTQTQRKPPARPPHRPGARVLLIEDSEDIRYLLTLELERLGHSVIAATDGSSGLERVQFDRPDVVISDIKMPGLDGYQLIRALRAKPEFSRIPAIALTGFGAKHDFERAMAAGFDACVSKPAEAEEISALIHSLVDPKNAMQA